jgi:hypothetical protein
MKDRPVTSTKKAFFSVGAENTFSTDLTGFDAMVAELQPLVDRIRSLPIRKDGLYGRSAIWKQVA